MHHVAVHVYMCKSSCTHKYKYTHEGLYLLLSFVQISIQANSVGNCFNELMILDLEDDCNLNQPNKLQ